MVKALALPSSHNRDAAKALGAYYTSDVVAELMVRWAVRRREDTVIDPSFGGGAFLATAATRIAALGGDPAAQIGGVELDHGSYFRVLTRFTAALRSAPDLRSGNFFACTPQELAPVDAVVGNPPFIRYQSFNGEDREQALRCAAAQGVVLNRLASSWAPFTVHACAFVKPHGRLALVLPQEILHAAYATPVLQYLATEFRRVAILTFRTKLFPELSENTILLLAEEKMDGARADVRLLDSTSAETLKGQDAVAHLHHSLLPYVPLNSRLLTAGQRR